MARSRPTIIDHCHRSWVAEQPGAVPNTGCRLMVAPVALWAAGGSLAQPPVNLRALDFPLGRQHPDL